MKPIVYIVDDDSSVRESLERLVEEAGWQPQAFGSPADFLLRARAGGPSALVMDLNLPGVDGLALQERLAADGRGTATVFTSERCDVPTSVRAMKAGAVDVLLKPSPDEAVIAAVREALQRSGATLAAQSESRAKRAAYESLTPREREVLEGVVSGKLNKQVGWHLGISEITVKTHRGNVMRKMGATSFAHLVNLARELGVQPPPMASAA